jgi:membrane protease YdiL (CAAX protease family)
LPDPGPAESSDIQKPEMAAAEPAPPEFPSPPHLIVQDVFIGRDGLRAGWSLLLFLAIFLGLLLGTTFLLSAAGLSSSQASTPDAAKPLTAKVALAAEVISLFSVAVATWIMAKIEHRPASAFGLAGKRRLPNFLAGLASGVALLSILVFSLRATGLLVFDGRLLFGRAALRHGAIWLLGFLLVGMFEEYFFRGYLQFTLARGISGIYGTFQARGQNALGFWTSAVLLSFGFGFTHETNFGESPLGLLAVGLIGLVFCLSLWRTGSLWWAIGFHASWDWAQSFLYGVADSGNMVEGHLFATHPAGRPIFSGGLTGPEGSLFILPIVGLAAAIILLTLPRMPLALPAADPLGANRNAPDEPSPNGHALQNPTDDPRR